MSDNSKKSKSSDIVGSLTEMDDKQLMALLCNVMGVLKSRNLLDGEKTQEESDSTSDEEFVEIPESDSPKRDSEPDEFPLHPPMTIPREDFPPKFGGFCPPPPPPPFFGVPEMNLDIRFGGQFPPPPPPPPFGRPPPEMHGHRGHRGGRCPRGRYLRGRHSRGRWGPDPREYKRMFFEGYPPRDFYERGFPYQFPPPPPHHRRFEDDNRRRKRPCEGSC